MRKVNLIALQTRRRNKDKNSSCPPQLTLSVICIFNFQTQNFHSNVATFPYKCTLLPPVALQSLQMNSNPHFGFPFLKNKTSKQAHV